MLPHPNSEWPICDLARRVQRGLDLAEAAIALVAADNPGIDLEALEAPPNKVIAETAMFLRAAAAVPPDCAPGLAARVNQLTCDLLPHARHPRVAIGMALHPALALDYAAAHLVLARAGYPDLEFDGVLAAALASPAACARERLPHRELEQVWLAWLAGGPPPSEELVARTAIARGVDLLTGSRDDLYALTHALLYASDFGGHDLQLPVPAVDLLASTRSALAGALDDDDFDLAGELLLTWPFLGAQWDACASFAFAILARIEDEVGILPSLSLDRQGYQQQPPEARKHYVAATAYHTAFVMGLLCAVMLRRNSRPEVLASQASGSSAFADQLLSRLSSDERRPQWLRDAQALSPAGREACASLFLDVSLRRAIRRLDLAEVQRLLQDAVGSQVALTLLCAQAAGILRRLAGIPVLTGGTVSSL